MTPKDLIFKPLAADVERSQCLDRPHPEIQIIAVIDRYLEGDTLTYGYHEHHVIRSHQRNWVLVRHGLDLVDVAVLLQGLTPMHPLRWNV